MFFNGAYSIINNKDELNKEENVFKDNGYQESIISKIFKRVTNKNSLTQSNQEAPVTDIEKKIRISIHLTFKAPVRN